MGNSGSFSRLTEEQQMHRRRAKEGRYKERLENMEIRANRDLVDNEYFATFCELYASSMEDSAKCTPAEYTPLTKELEERHINLIFTTANKFHSDKQSGFENAARWTMAQIRRHYQRYKNEAEAKASAPKYSEQLGNRISGRHLITTAPEDIKMAAFCKLLADNDFIDSHFYMRVNEEWNLYPVTDKNHAPDEGTQVYYVKADTCLLLDRRLQQKNQSLANYIKISNSALLMLFALGFRLDDGYLRQPDFRRVAGEHCEISKQPCLMCRGENVLSTLPLLYCSSCITTKIFEPIGEQIFGLALFKGQGPSNRNQRSKNSAKVYKEIFSMKETSGLISELLCNNSVNTLRSFAQRVEGYQYKEMLERMSGWCDICWSQCTVFEYGRQTAVCNYRISSSPFYFERGFRRMLTPIQLQAKELLTSILAPYRLTPTPSRFMVATTIEKPKEKQTSLPSIAIPPMIAFSSNPEKASAKLGTISSLADSANTRANTLLNGGSESLSEQAAHDREALAAREALSEQAALDCEALAARESLSEQAARE